MRVATGKPEPSGKMSRLLSFHALEAAVVASQAEKSKIPLVE